MKSFEYEKPLNGRHIYSSSDNRNSRDLRKDDPHLAEGSTTGIQATETRLFVFWPQSTVNHSVVNMEICTSSFLFVFLPPSLSLCVDGWDNAGPLAGI